MPDAKEPHEYERRILLSVLGRTPQILTETLYALAVKSEPRFVPTEIHVVTTAAGRDSLMVLLEDGSPFFALCDEHLDGARGLKFSRDSFHVIKDDNDVEIDDIDDEASSMLAADAITKVVRELAQDENAAIHASLAGGRKTMGFYLGYALSLLGRRQDRLSHVLVSAPFESDSEFYYPPRKPRILDIKGEKVRTNKARIMLAHVPIVYLVDLKEGLRQQLVRGEMTYSETVAEMERALVQPRVKLVCDKSLQTRVGVEITAAGTSFSMSKVQFALYAVMVRRARSGGDHFVAFDTEDFLEEYLQEFVHITDEYADRDRNKTVENLKAAIDKVQKDDRIQRENLRERFSSYKNKINDRIDEALGPQIGDAYHVKSGGKYGATKYGVHITPDCIKIYDLSGDTAG